MIIVVPARGGSKRLPYKNIQPLSGKPLLSHTLEVIAAADLGCPVYVSTDDKRIAEIASTHNDVRVIMRPDALAHDTASTESVLLHVLDIVAATGFDPRWVMTLPPTSPFRRSETIRRFADAMDTDSDSQDCLMSTTENRSDFWRPQPDGTLARLFPDAPRRQQERMPLFEENSAIYVTRVAALRETGFILGRRVRGLAIPAIEGFDINTADDMKLAECIASMLSKS